MKKVFLLVFVFPVILSAQTFGSFNLGVGIPVADFAADDTEQAGYAVSGLHVGLDILHSVQGEWLYGMASLSGLSLKTVFPDPIEATNWIGAFPMYGLRIMSHAQDSIPGVYVFAQGGLNIMRTPEISALGVTQAPSWGNAFAYSVGFGMSFTSDFIEDIRVQYYSADPTFDLSASSGLSSSQSTHTQPVRIVRVVIGSRLDF